ncbi:MAG: sigma-70 family RNA polymerase sigma factor [Lachnospiraceae bacterium]|nr:sigma-70 family RNA polymerase sigma factor [Lachnospiraceae bacterium]
MATIDSTDSVKAARRGDMEAFEFLYNKSIQNFRAYLYTMLKSEQDIEDVLQEAYIQIYKSLDKLAEPKSFLRWGQGICRNTALHHIRTADRHWGLDDFRPQNSDDEYEGMDAIAADEEYGDFADPQVQLDAAETRRLLDAMIGDLPEMQRLCISLWQQGLSTAEIAAQLDIPKGTVNSNVNYAKKKIKSKVLLLEKQGTKLYGLAPIPFFLWIMSQFRENGVLAPGAEGAVSFASIAKKLQSGTASASVQADRTVSATQAAQTTGSAMGSAAGVAAASIGGAKIAAIVIAACALVGGGAYLATSGALSSDDASEALTEETEAGLAETDLTDAENMEEEAEEISEEAESQETTHPAYLVTRELYTGYYKGWSTEYTIDYYYDENGWLIQKTTVGTEQDPYEEVAEVSNRTEYSYDANGNLLSEIEYDSAGQTNYSYTWEYDADGNQITEVYMMYYSGDFLLSDTAEYSYDENGNRIAEYNTQKDSSYSETSSHCTYEYDSYGNIIKQNYYGETRSSTVEYLYTYDENGNILSKETVDGEETSTRSYTYDENGLLLSETEELYGETELITYTYDENGNMASCISYYGMYDDDPSQATSYSCSEYEYSRFEDLTAYEDAAKTEIPQLTEEQQARVEDLFYPISMFTGYGYADYNVNDPASFWNIMDAVISYLYGESWFPEGSVSGQYISYSASVVEQVAAAVFADFTGLPEVSGTSWVEYADGSYQFLLGDLPWVDDYSIQSWEDNGDGSWSVRTSYSTAQGAEAEMTFVIIPNAYAARTGSSLLLFSISDIEPN